MALTYRWVPATKKLQVTEAFITATLVVNEFRPSPTPTVNTPVGPPAGVTDLRELTHNTTSVTVIWTQVNDGTGAPANYDVRYSQNPPDEYWFGDGYPNQAVKIGTQIGASMSHTFTGLASGTRHMFQLVPYRGTLNVDAVVGSLSAQVEVTTDVVVGPGGGSFGENEPAGFTTLTDRPFLAADEGWWSALGWGSGNIVTDGSAPSGDGSVGRVTLTSAFPGGESPATTGFTFSVQPTDVYIAIWHKLSANWVGHSSGVNKVLFLIDPSGTGGNGGTPFILNALMSQGSGSTYQYQGRNSHGVVGPTNYPHIATVNVTKGQWALVEVLIRAQNSAGAADGELHIWVNGTKVTQVTNATWTASNGNRTWEHTKWEAVWGGTGETPGVTMFQYIDRMYVSGSF